MSTLYDDEADRPAADDWYTRLQRAAHDNPTVPLRFYASGVALLTAIYGLLMAVIGYQSYHQLVSRYWWLGTIAGLLTYGLGAVYCTVNRPVASVLRSAATAVGGGVLLGTLAAHVTWLQPTTGWGWWVAVLVALAFPVVGLLAPPLFIWLQDADIRAMTVVQLVLWPLVGGLGIAWLIHLDYNAVLAWCVMIWAAWSGLYAANQVRYQLHNFLQTYLMPARLVQAMPLLMALGLAIVAMLQRRPPH